MRATAPLGRKEQNTESAGQGWAGTDWHCLSHRSHKVPRAGRGAEQTLWAQGQEEVAMGMGPSPSVLQT